MKNISALVHICRVVYYYVHIYMLMIYLGVYFQCRISSFYNRSIIRLDDADVKSHSYRAHYQGYISICLCLGNFVRTPIWGFIFVRLLSQCYYFISNSVIVIDSSSVFLDDVIIYSRLFALTYISPVCYMIYGEDHVSSKNELAWNFNFSRVVCRVYH